MPRIDTLQVGWLWVAFTVNDWGHKGTPRWGVTKDHAYNRVVAALSTPTEGQEAS